MGRERGVRERKRLGWSESEGVTLGAREGEGEREGGEGEDGAERDGTRRGSGARGFPSRVS
jgi:hypothetical protein